MRGELTEAERGAEFDIEPGVSSPNRKPRATLPVRVTQEPAGPRGHGAGGGGRDNPTRPKVKAATAGAIPGGLLGEYVLSVVEGRYGDLPRELDALVVPTGRLLWYAERPCLTARAGDPTRRLFSSG